MIAEATSTPRLNKSEFFRSIGYEPHAGQLAVHRSRAPRRVLACGVRWGKSLCAATEGLAAAMAPAERSIGWVAAPTYDLSDKVFREVSYIATQHLQPFLIAIKEGERRIMLRNLAGGTSEIRAKSADNPTSLLGEGLDWLIVDEAARLRPHIWEGHLSQRLIDKRGWALLISTPRGKGWFYDAFRRGQRNEDSDFASWNSPSWQNPHLDREMIERERERLPERVFLQEYGAEFLEGAGQVFRNVRECATGVFQDPEPGAFYHAGLDLAKVADHTVLVIVNTRHEVVFVDRFHRIDWTQQVERITHATHRYNHALVTVDSTGVGEPVFEQLRKANCRVVPYPFTASSKRALINNLAILLERGELTLPRPDLWPEGIDELEAFEYDVTETGNVRTGAPDGTHDDCVIALSLAAWSLNEARRRRVIRQPI